MKLPSGDIFAYIARHSEYAVNGTGKRHVERVKLQLTLDVGRKLGHLLGSEYTLMAQAPPGQKTPEEYAAWASGTIDTFVRDAKEERQTMLGPQQTDKRIGDSRAGELAGFYHQAKGNVRIANKLSKDRVTVNKKIGRKQQYTPPKRGRW